MNRILLNGVVIIMAGLFLAATAWNFSAVASMPEKYVRVDRNRADHERIERKLDTIIDILIGEGRDR